jgi:hypothetical protein
MNLHSFDRTKSFDRLWTFSLTGEIGRNAFDRLENSDDKDRQLDSLDANILNVDKVLNARPYCVLIFVGLKTVRKIEGVGNSSKLK